MLRQTVLAALAAGSVFGLAACVQESGAPGASSGAAAAGESQCFSTRSVRGFSHGPEDGQILVEAGNDFYMFETRISCPDLDYSHALAFDSSGTFICDGQIVDIVLPRAQISNRCPVRMIGKLTEEEVEAEGL